MRPVLALRTRRISAYPSGLYRNRFLRRPRCVLPRVEARYFESPQTMSLRTDTRRGAASRLGSPLIARRAFRAAPQLSSMCETAPCSIPVPCALGAAGAPIARTHVVAGPRSCAA